MRTNSVPKLETGIHFLKGPHTRTRDNNGPRGPSNSAVGGATLSGGQNGSTVGEFESLGAEESGRKMEKRKWSGEKICACVCVCVCVWGAFASSRRQHQVCISKLRQRSSTAICAPLFARPLFVNLPAQMKRPSALCCLPYQIRSCSFSFRLFIFIYSSLSLCPFLFLVYAPPPEPQPRTSAAAATSHHLHHLDHHQCVGGCAASEVAAASATIAAVIERGRAQIIFSRFRSHTTKGGKVK